MTAGLSLDVKRMMRSLERQGLEKTDLSGAETCYRGAYRQLTQASTVVAERMWLQACIIYQAKLMKEENWRQLAKLPTDLRSRLNLKDLEVRRLYALMLANTCMASYRADESATDVAYIAEGAVKAFEAVNSIQLNRWWGCALALLANTLWAVDFTEDAKDRAHHYALQALEKFQKPHLPSLRTFVFAQYVAGVGDGYVPGGARSGRAMPFELSDFYYFQGT